MVQYKKFRVQIYRYDRLIWDEAYERIADYKFTSEDVIEKLERLYGKGDDGEQYKIDVFQNVPSYAITAAFEYMRDNIYDHIHMSTLLARAMMEVELPDGEADRMDAYKKRTGIHRLRWFETSKGHWMYTIKMWEEPVKQEPKTEDQVMSDEDKARKRVAKLFGEEAAKDAKLVELNQKLAGIGVTMVVPGLWKLE